MQPDAINRSVPRVPGNLQSPQKAAAEPKPSSESPEIPAAANWIQDPPEPLVAAKDFHYAIAASFRMNETMGNEFLFDEVR